MLSNGHASAMLYALLHLTGYDLPIEELKRFRQLHSKTPGHPEFGVTLGVCSAYGTASRLPASCSTGSTTSSSRNPSRGATVPLCCWAPPPTVASSAPR